MVSALPDKLSGFLMSDPGQEFIEFNFQDRAQMQVRDHHGYAAAILPVSLSVLQEQFFFFKLYPDKCIDRNNDATDEIAGERENQKQSPDEQQGPCIERMPDHSMYPDFKQPV